MTDKNKEDLLNIYDNNNDPDAVSSTKSDSKNIDSDISSLELDDIKSNLPWLDIIDESTNTKENISNFSDEKEEKNENVDLNDNIELNTVDSDNESDWIEDLFSEEIGELKNKWEKKSFFWNLFKKKKKEEVESITSNEKQEKNIEWKNKISSSNIFDDFNQDEWLLDEINQIKKDRDRDMFYYFEKTAWILQIIFILLLIVLWILSSYIYVQNKVYEWINKDNQLLWPFCFVLLGDINYEWDFCTSISTLKKEYVEKLDDTKKYQVSSVLSVVSMLYDIENFTKTKDVMFLKDKTSNKLKILKIIEEFDDLKNEFATVDKQTIQCSSIDIDKESQLLTMKCSAYSAWYESWIRWFDGKNVPESLLKWTSISIANSFLNYITIESDIFTIVDKQKLFISNSVIWLQTGFTNETPFSLKLKYNLD